MKKKIALITGVTGQDGSYLAEFLLKKNYIVHGIKRRSSLINTQRLDHLYIDPHNKTNFFLHYGDVLDANNLIELIKKIKPNEVYNLAAQSHVLTSFSTPDYTTQVNALGTLRILEAIRVLGLTSRTKFYQASSSEIFGNSKKKKQSEKTSFNPESPYASSKLYAYWITKNYRDAYGLFASNGILFNHESPRRGETFVTRKIVIGLCKIKLDQQKKLLIGNLYAKRDWGHAKEYVLAMWKILQQKKADDYVIATGVQYSVKDFINIVANELKIKIFWKGKGINEKGYNKEGKVIIECDKNYFRPLDVNTLLGDSRKARKVLKWKPQIKIKDLAKEMVVKELERLKTNNFN